MFAEVLARMTSAYERALPLFPGAVEAIVRVADEYPVAVASGSPRELIDLVLNRTGISEVCSAVGYGDEAERGKPAPDVYLDVVDRLGASPSRTVGVEDSESGLRAVLSAGMQAVAIVSPAFRLPEELVEEAGLVLGRLGDLTVSLLESAFD